MAWKVCEEANKNVQDTDSDFTVLCYNEEEAENLAKYLNRKYGTEDGKPTVIPYDNTLDLHEDFVEWDTILNWLNKTADRLNKIEEIYQEEFKIELKNAIETGVDFKGIYGGNTEKTRKQYVDEQLSDLIEEKKLLKSHQSDDLRRIEFLKKLIAIKIKLIDVDKGVEL